MWMWECINKNQPTKHELTWLVEGMKLNSLIWVMDRSNNWKKAADLCGVGWIIFCSKTGLRLTATFWERSISASSYWAEMLGLCALHLFAKALSEFYKIQEWKATLCCDNKRALEISEYTNQRIRPSAKCIDIQQSLKATKHTYRKIYVFACVRPYGQISSLAPTVPYPAAQLHMQQSCQTSRDISNDGGLLQKANPIITQRGHCSSHLGEQKSPTTFLITSGFTQARK
jgi:hypothetical protein